MNETPNPVIAEINALTAAENPVERVEKLTDLVVLADLAENARLVAVKAAAVKRLAELEADGAEANPEANANTPAPTTRQANKAIRKAKATTTGEVLVYPETGDFHFIKNELVADAKAQGFTEPE